jgi:hypothetical protein
MITARRNSFELESKSEETASRFLRVTTNGVFHLIKPIRRPDEILWLSGLFNQIAEILLYCATIMKQKKQNAQQSAYIILKNVHELEVRISERQTYHRWFFSRSDPEPYIIEFSPSDGWKEIGKILKKIFKDLCHDISFKIAPQFVNGRLTEILSTNFYVTCSHGFNDIQIPAINIFEFGLFDEEK